MGAPCCLDEPLSIVSCLEYIFISVTVALNVFETNMFYQLGHLLPTAVTRKFLSWQGEELKMEGSGLGRVSFVFFFLLKRKKE